MLEVYNLDFTTKAILQNAYGKVETEELNAVGSLKFSLPGDDEKAQYCKRFHFVRYNDGQYYRLIKLPRSDDGKKVLTFGAEHAIATLVDDVLFGSHIVGNIGVYTADCINYVLNRQTTRRWVLGDCDFVRQFEYGWENENLLAALFSIPMNFTDKYKWVFDMTSYPWVVSLKRIDESSNPQFFVAAGKNLLKQTTDDNSTICTRLYCLGYGEGVNQLTISSVNGGLPYLQSPQEYIDKYGLISSIFVDRRFEDAESLMARGQALLDELQNPILARNISAADLYKITKADYDKAEIGRILRLEEDGTKTYFTKIIRNHDVAGDISFTIANKPIDIASSIADLADRQRIEQVYAQGSTQLYAHGIQANATSDEGAILNFWIPSEMRIINKVLAKISLAPFRAYSKATKSGGGAAVTSSTEDLVVNSMPDTVTGLRTRSADGSGGSHSHGIPSFTVEALIIIEGHDHRVIYPAHVHNIEAGIFEFGSPTSAKLYVNGIYKADIGGDADLDITAYLLDDSMTIPRNSWIKIEVVPNDLAYITIDLYVQGFVQSRGGATY